jgi:hypothetical protein
MKLDDVALRQRDQRGSVVDDHVVADLRLLLDIDHAHLLRRAFARVTKKAAVVDVGCALFEGERAVLQVRQDPIADRVVVAHEIELGQSRVGEEESFGMRDCDAGN